MQARALRKQLKRALRLTEETQAQKQQQRHVWNNNLTKKRKEKETAGLNHEKWGSSQIPFVFILGGHNYFNIMDLLSFA